MTKSNNHKKFFYQLVQYEILGEYRASDVGTKSWVSDEFDELYFVELAKLASIDGNIPKKVSEFTTYLMTDPACGNIYLLKVTKESGHLFTNSGVRNLVRFIKESFTSLWNDNRRTNQK